MNASWFLIWDSLKINYLIPQGQEVSYRESPSLLPPLNNVPFFGLGVQIIPLCRRRFRPNMVVCRLKRCFLVSLLCIFVTLIAAFVLITYISDDFIVIDDHYMREPGFTPASAAELEEARNEPIRAPVILWWTGFTHEPGAYKTCGSVECFFTIKRKYKNHPKLKVFMFYASDLQATDLPLPREPHHEWAVLHEESPKNNILFSFEDMLVLFNHTSTFRRESDYPITTQHLISEQWLLSKKYYKSVQAKNQLQREKGLAPIVYVHSDCDPPSDRDHYVKLLMEYIPVDSYGLCLNNKKMPQHLQQPMESMDHSDFYELLSQYKFALAMENAVCEDYITEKLWRPLMLGVVPIAYGSPSVTDLLPSNSSAVVITDFQDVKHLAQHIHKLNTDDAAYERYLTWKKEGSINPLLQQHLRHRDWTPDGDDPATKDFISGFECFVCQRIHENLRRQKKGLLPLHHVANLSHYGCPVPHLFDEKGVVGKESDWKYDWMSAGKLAHALRWYVENKVPFTEEELHKQAVVLSEEHPVQ